MVAANIIPRVVASFVWPVEREDIEDYIETGKTSSDQVQMLFYAQIAPNH